MDNTHIQDVTRNWNSVWEKTGYVPSWDSLSQIVFDVLSREIGRFKNLNILECGSGTGRVSLKLAANKAKVTLLDTSTSAINSSRRLFRDHRCDGKFIEGSIFDLPFGNDAFDVVWNAGVLEHFLDKEQLIALREMTRVCRKGGLIVTMNPYKYAVFYRIWKWYAERKNIWAAGYERPISTLKDIALQINGLSLKEYTVGFDESLKFFSNIPNTRMIIGGIKRFRRFFDMFDVGGYLRISVINKLLS